MYILGCSNAGKSSLFNALLASDFCRIAARDVIQRATSSIWPGKNYCYEHELLPSFLLVCHRNKVVQKSCMHVFIL